MKKILLITTDGCDACKIMDGVIKEALSNTRRKVDYEKVNFKILPVNYLKRFKFKDFPTIQYIVDDVVKFQTVGSYPYPVVNRYIDIYLK